ncbi:MAG TPA: acylphosphatase, partial [Candidatus Manganitrophaceae bacterium]
MLRSRARSGTDPSRGARRGSPERLRIVIRGAVQGVGFRPFVYRLAEELGLTGWVCNSLRGVRIEAEGDRSRLEAFLIRIERQKPPRS